MVIIENKSGGGILNNLFPLTLPHSAFGQLWDDRTFNVGRRVLTMLPGFIQGRHEYLSLHADTFDASLMVGLKGVIGLQRCPPPLEVFYIL